MKLFFALIQAMSFFLFVAYLYCKSPAFSPLHSAALRPRHKLILYVLFAALSVTGTYLGLPVRGAIANTRAIGPILAGLIGGPWLGAAVGLTGGLHRWWLGGFTGLACGLSTLTEGIIGGMVHLYLVRRGRSEEVFRPWVAFATTVLAEATQMAIILAVARPFQDALALVEVIALPMIAANSAGAALFISIIRDRQELCDQVGAVSSARALRIAERTLASMAKGFGAAARAGAGRGAARPGRGALAARVRRPARPGPHARPGPDLRGPAFPGDRAGPGSPAGDPDPGRARRRPGPPGRAEAGRDHPPHPSARRDHPPHRAPHGRGERALRRGDRPGRRPHHRSGHARRGQAPPQGHRGVSGRRRGDAFRAGRGRAGGRIGPRMLVVRNLHAGYGLSEVLVGTSLEVKPGTVVALIGANGAGKTTTMRAVSGLITPSRGEVLLDGQPVHGLSAFRIARLGLAHSPEGRQVFGPLSAEDNLLLGAYRRLPRFLGFRARAAQDLARVYQLFPKLEERRLQLAGTLSGGEQQMLAIGRALMARPKVMLLDEPSMGYLG